MTVAGANLSQRIDMRYPKYTCIRGSDRERRTDHHPIKDALMPTVSERKIGNRDMHDMTLRLKLTPMAPKAYWPAMTTGHIYGTSTQARDPRAQQGESADDLPAFIKYAMAIPTLRAQCTHFIRI